MLGLNPSYMLGPALLHMSVLTHGPVGQLGHALLMARAEAKQKHMSGNMFPPNTKSWIWHTVTSTHIPLAKASLMDKPTLNGAGKYTLSWVRSTPKAHTKDIDTGRDQELETIVQSISGSIRLKGVCSSFPRPLVGASWVYSARCRLRRKSEEITGQFFLWETGCREGGLLLLKIWMSKEERIEEGEMHKDPHGSEYPAW